MTEMNENGLDEAHTQEEVGVTKLDMRADEDINLSDMEMDQEEDQMDRPRKKLVRVVWTREEMAEVIKYMYFHEYLDKDMRRKSGDASSTSVNGIVDIINHLTVINKNLIYIMEEGNAITITITIGNLYHFVWNYTFTVSKNLPTLFCFNIRLRSF